VAANVTEGKARDWIDRTNELVREQRSTPYSLYHIICTGIYGIVFVL
jgi:hypothetical protein